MIIGATLLVLLIIVHIASIEAEEKPQRVYTCHNNHVFTEPVKQKVLDYDGFVEEIDACPICDSDVKLHKE
ncbi:hypothetical protein Blastoid_7 [Bacillus phage Blastoid]|uniref:Uncharacterized protein n=1 Tax=Bacillus phage Blastoid TaxID=2880540 RepID=U5PSS9_9CAUD|nr:hypothetical protein V456_gp07 [Bacillus phage Blastoid]AGY46806.1 hypothetical protein Blastoid_7 [Bacillus phage Blastoid]